MPRPALISTLFCSISITRGKRGCQRADTQSTPLIGKDMLVKLELTGPTVRVKGFREDGTQLAPQPRDHYALSAPTGGTPDLLIRAENCPRCVIVAEAMHDGVRPTNRKTT